MGKYGAMNVNERLLNAGLLEAFDACINGFDDNGAGAILARVEFSPEDARATVATVKRDPAKYGYSGR